MRRLAATLFALGFIVNAPAVIVGVGAQLANGLIPPMGPSVVRQAELVPVALAYTSGHIYDRFPTSTEPPSHVAIWQFRVTRAMGRRGAPIALLGSLILAFGAMFAAFQLRRVLRPTERRFAGPALWSI